MLIWKNKNNLKFILLAIFVIFFMIGTAILGFNYEFLRAEGNDSSYESTLDTIDLRGDENKLTIRFFNLQFSEEEKAELREQHDTPIKSGDAILITTPDDENILIDAGMPQLVEQLDRLLDKSGVDRIDYAFATHPHWDHIGGFLTLFNTREIGEFYHVNVPNNTSTYNDYLSLIDSQDIAAKYIEAGDYFVLGDLLLEVLHPPQGTNPDDLPSADEISTTRINNLSLVIRAEYQNNSFLFTGDIYREAERELLANYDAEYLNVNVVQAPHHGEETSSSFEFIEAVKPEITLISRDELASISIFNRYLGYGSDVYVTGLNGHVIVESDGDEISVTPEKTYEPTF